MPLPFLHPFAPTTKERFITLTRGSGARVWDADGRELIDAMASLWYCQIGHGRDEMADVVAAQMRQLEAYSCFDPFTNEPAEQLTKRIAELSPMPDARVFLAGSGSEAVDTAMKLARLGQRMAGHPERHLIISRERGYHGTNLGGTSAQGLPANKEGYGSLVPDVHQVPADDIEALSRLMGERESEIAAVLLEPVQGAAGVYPPPPGYLAEARRLCDEHGAYLIFDEVITGFGRLGRWFAAEHFDVVPDLTTFAKGVSSGYQPVGGVIVGAAPRAALEQDGFILRHGYTYSGHPTSCAAALANINIIEREGLLDRARHVGGRLEAGLHALVGEGLDHVRGDTAVFGAALDDAHHATTVRDALLDRGVIARAIGDNTVTFCPPLVITDEQIDRVIDGFADALASTAD
ncbi:MAG: aminotransferase class III-fold pyridoxal phosphate-dependent enzyme, partial [Actinomycetota bacterium]